MIVDPRPAPPAPPVDTALEPTAPAPPPPPPHQFPAQVSRTCAPPAFDDTAPLPVAVPDAPPAPFGLVWSIPPEPPSATMPDPPRRNFDADPDEPLLAELLAAPGPPAPTVMVYVLPGVTE